MKKFEVGDRVRLRSEGHAFARQFVDTEGRIGVIKDIYGDIHMQEPWHTVSFPNGYHNSYWAECLQSVDEPILFPPDFTLEEIERAQELING